MCNAYAFVPTNPNDNGRQPQIGKYPGYMKTPPEDYAEACAQGYLSVMQRITARV